MPSKQEILKLQENYATYLFKKGEEIKKNPRTVSHFGNSRPIVPALVIKLRGKAKESPQYRVTAKSRVPIPITYQTRTEPKDQINVQKEFKFQNRARAPPEPEPEELTLKSPTSETNLYKYIDKITFEPGLSDTTITKLSEKLKRTIDIESTNKILTSLKGTNQWIDCPPLITQELKILVDAETTSTLYMLRIISGSIITSSEFNTEYMDSQVTLMAIPPYIRFKIKSGFNETNLTGLWEIDKKMIDLVVFKRTDVRMETCLIMAFGPSASGKTAIGQSLISALHMCGIVQERFLKIDGGDYRELSVVYKNIMTTIHSKEIPGFNNMHGKIFNAGEIKKGVLDYLLLQRLRIKPSDTEIDSNMPVSSHLINYYNAEYGIRGKKVEIEFNPDTEINLYVPDTVVSCTTTCSTKIKEYNIISGNNKWIGLNIYQHLGLDTNNVIKFFQTFLSNNRVSTNLGECSYLEPEYKCKTCKTSGEQREKIEGKKYDYKTYPVAIFRGEMLARTATKGWMIIHSSGGNKFKWRESYQPCVNVIEESTWNFDEVSKSKLAKFGLLFNHYTKLNTSSLLMTKQKKNIFWGGKKTEKHKHKYNHRNSMKRRKI